MDFAIQAGEADEAATVSLAIDRLAVNLGFAISMIVPGYISTEVDPRLSFDTESSVARGRRIIGMYQELGVPKERVLIKLAATWEGQIQPDATHMLGINWTRDALYTIAAELDGNA